MLYNTFLEVALPVWSNFCGLAELSQMLSTSSLLDS